MEGPRTNGTDPMRTDDPVTDHDRRRRQILDVAADVFAERGFQGGTTKEIAKRVGLSQPSFYHYVGSKDDLVRAIANQVDADMKSVLEKADAASPDPVIKLQTLIVEFTRAVLVNRRTFTVYWHEYNSFPQDVAAEVRRDEAAFVHSVTDLVRGCQEAGRLPADVTPGVTARAILGMASWTYRWYNPEGPADPDGIAAAFCRLIGLADPER